MPLRSLIDVARTGLTSVVLYPVRSGASIAALTAVLVPYLAGLGLVKGIESEAEASTTAGPDLYVRGSQFGRAAPLPLAAVRDVAAIPGVDRAVPRIVGEIVLGKEQIRCVLVGMPVEHFPQWAACIDGKPPEPGAGHQLVLGTAVARRLGLAVGSRIPPFYRNDRLGERVSRVVGIFEPGASLWQSHVVLTTFETAAVVFDQPGLATDLLVFCRPGAAPDVTRAIVGRLSYPASHGEGIVRPEVTSADELRAQLPRAARHREGVFNLYFVVVFVVAILVLLVTSGLGMSERRREIGILKASGWQTDEVLLRSLAESVALSLLAACLSFLLAWFWLRVLNGYGLERIFLAGTEGDPDIRLPFQLTPVPLLLGFVVSLVVVLVGTLPSTWLSAITPPRVAMR
jgi:ABC-type lipoprotein release transport system permease subunit